MEAVTQEIVAFLMTDNSLKLETAMNIFYNSALFDRVHDSGTGLYLEGSAYVYELLKDELTISASVEKYSFAGKLTP
jgi:hypothetical protein